MAIGRPIGEYAANLRGIAQYSLDRWQYWSRASKPNEYSSGYNAGSMSALNRVLFLITGLDVATVGPDRVQTFIRNIPA